MKEAIASWEVNNSREFLISGERFEDFISRQWQDNKQQKEDEKHQRVGIDILIGYLFYEFIMLLMNSLVHQNLNRPYIHVIDRILVHHDSSCKNSRVGQKMLFCNR